MNSTVKHTYTNPTLTDMTKSKTLRKGEEIIKPTGEWVTRELSFRLLIQLQEYNKSLEKLLGFLCKDENKHIFINLSKEDGNFYKTDLWDIMLRINTICDSGLKGKDRDWEIASNGTFFKPHTKMKTKTEDETLKFFQKINDENWVSDTELFERNYEMNKHKENYEKMKIVRANKKPPTSGMKKPKGIEEWCD